MADVVHRGDLSAVASTGLVGKGAAKWVAVVGREETRYATDMVAEPATLHGEGDAGEGEGGGCEEGEGQGVEGLGGGAGEAEGHGGEGPGGADGSDCRRAVDCASSGSSEHYFIGDRRWRRRTGTVVEEVKVDWPPGLEGNRSQWDSWFHGITNQMTLMMRKMDGLLSTVHELRVRDSVVGMGKADVLMENFALTKIEKQAEEGEEDKGDTDASVKFADGVREGYGMWGTVEKWFVDKGYGFLTIQGKTVFCHSDRVVGQNWLRQGDAVWATVVEDKARGDESWKATQVMDQLRWEEKQAKKNAEKALATATRASKVACKSMEKTQKMMERMEDVRIKIDTRPKRLSRNVTFEQFQKFTRLAKEMESDRKGETVVEMRPTTLPTGGGETRQGNGDGGEGTVDGGKGRQETVSKCELVAGGGGRETAGGNRGILGKQHAAIHAGSTSGDCKTSAVISSTKVDVNASSKVASPTGVCPSGHVLKAFKTPNARYWCSVCEVKVDQDTELFGCQICNYDECVTCRSTVLQPKTNLEVRPVNEIPKAERNVVCPKGHHLFETIASGGMCDMCNKRLGKGERVHVCRLCDLGNKQNWCSCLLCLHGSMRSSECQIPLGILCAPMTGEHDPEVAGMFREMAEVEDGLDEKAQSALEDMGCGPAAELLQKVVDRGGRIRDHSKYVVAAAKRAGKDQAAASTGERSVGTAGRGGDVGNSGEPINHDRDATGDNQDYNQHRDDRVDNNHYTAHDDDDYDDPTHYNERDRRDHTRYDNNYRHGEDNHGDDSQYDNYGDPNQHDYQHQHHLGDYDQHDYQDHNGNYNGHCDDNHGDRNGEGGDYDVHDLDYGEGDYYDYYDGDDGGGGYGGDDGDYGEDDGEYWEE